MTTITGRLDLMVDDDDVILLNRTCRIQAHLSWDPASSRKGFLSRVFGASTSHDLDLLVSTHDQDGTIIDLAWHRQSEAHDSALQYSGDSVDGRATDADESVTIELAALPSTVTVVAITVSADGHGPVNLLGQVQNAHLSVRVHDRVLTDIDLTETVPGHSTAVPILLTRTPAGWALHTGPTENVPGEDPLDTTRHRVLTYLASA